ncbi:MAG TPA: hypothetical protein VF941_14400, partial [Clostridia bacterium]
MLQATTSPTHYTRFVDRRCRHRGVLALVLPPATVAVLTVLTPYCKGVSPLNLSEQFSLIDWLAFCSAHYAELMPQRGELYPLI